MNLNNTKITNTKLVATMGPTFDTEEQMELMLKAGVNVVRLNASHGSIEEHQGRVDRVRKVAKKLDLNISILLDTKGPEIRIHSFENKKIDVPFGKQLEIYTKKEIVGDENKFSVSYQDLTDCVKPGSLILADDGKLTLEVLSVDKSSGVVTVISKNKHKLSNNKAINVPGARLTLPFIGERDTEFILWGIKQRVDYIAASFVSDESDVLELRKILVDNHGEFIQIMPKIESLFSLTKLNEILQVSDAVMLARGDLGVEIPFDQVPFYENLIIAKALAFGKPIVIATQMLDSMGDNPRPTRAEVTDIYFAVNSGTDATMLSGESASGQFPVESVEVMKTVQTAGEQWFNYQDFLIRAYSTVPTRNAETAFSLAKSVTTENISFVMAFSKSGALIKALSRFRLKTPIIAMFEDEKLLTAFGANYGVYTQKVDSYDDFSSDEKIKAYAKSMNIKGTILVANKSTIKKIEV